MRSCRCAIVQAILSLLLCVRRSYVYACFPVCSFTRSAVARSLPLMASWNRAFTVCTRCVTRQAMGRRRAVATEARAHPHLTSLFLFNDIVSCLLEIAPRPRAPPRGTAPTAALARPPAPRRPGAPGAAQLGRSGARPRRELGETSGSRKRSCCRIIIYVSWALANPVSIDLISALGWWSTQRSRGAVPRSELRSRRARPTISWTVQSSRRQRRRRRSRRSRHGWTNVSAVCLCPALAAAATHQRLRARA